MLTVLATVTDELNHAAYHTKRTPLSTAQCACGMQRIARIHLRQLKLVFDGERKKHVFRQNTYRISWYFHNVFKIEFFVEDVHFQQVVLNIIFIIGIEI